MKMPLTPEGRAFWEQVYKEDRDYQRGIARVAMSPLPTPPLFLGGDPAKPSEPEMTKTAQERAAAMFATAIKPEPDLITLRLECMKMAVNDHFYEAGEPDYEKVADRFLHYVLNGSVDKA